MKEKIPITSIYKELKVVFTNATLDSDYVEIYLTEDISIRIFSRYLRIYSEDYDGFDCSSIKIEYDEYDDLADVIETVLETVKLIKSIMKNTKRYESQKSNLRLNDTNVVYLNNEGK